MTSDATGDRTEPFGKLLREFVAPVRGFVRSLVSDADVEPVVHATFETAWSKFDAIPLLSQRAWLFGVARNHVKNHVRSERRRELLIDAIISSRPEGEVELFADEVDAVRLGPILAALDQLTEGERELIQLLAWHEMSPSEIAIVLGISSNSARVRVHRARARLGSIVQGQNGRAER